MIYLVYGGSGSGKSAHAENLFQEVTKGETGALIYLATMQVYDAEGEQKVARHRALRAGKGFLTVEKPRDIQDTFKGADCTAAITDCAGILLECMSNLVANEMFTQAGICAENDVVEKIVAGMKVLASKTKHLVIVSNDVFDDGMVYDTDTTAYLQALARVNAQVAAFADQVVEVVAGIPCYLKIEKIFNSDTVVH